MMRLALLAALALPGCATLVESNWQSTASHAALPAYHIVVSDVQMESACGRHQSAYVFGCAIRLPSEHACVIFTRRDPAQWILAHERRHCDGWDHGTAQRKE